MCIKTRTVSEKCKNNYFCIKAKSASFLSESEFSGRGGPRLETGKDKRHFSAEVHIKFFTKLQIYFVSSFFKYQLGNKTRNLLFAFVGLVVNSLNRPTHSATVSVRKKVTFRPLVFIKNEIWLGI
jgi:hypothetical protein